MTQECDHIAGLIGRSEAMKRVSRQIRTFARSTVPVLFIGETGTGKNTAARALAEVAGQPDDLIYLNCACLSKGVVDSELFGHTKGAFTGAVSNRSGILRQADTGILFLDEISSLPLSTQAKLLQAIETGRFRPVGSDTETRSRFRLLAAAKFCGEKLVDEEKIRLDLYHRLGAAQITLPPLRARPSDVRPLARSFLGSYASRNGATPDAISDEALRMLENYSWPGNVRQLRNVVEAAAACSSSAEISSTDVAKILPDGAPERGDTSSATLAEAALETEREMIRDALRHSGGNRGKAAHSLGISESSLYRKLSRIEDLERTTEVEGSSKPSARM